MDNGLLSTGIGQLDEFLGGGLAPGSFVLLVAAPGAGTEILTKQFAAGRPEASDQDDLYVTTEESLDEARKAMDRFGFSGRPRIRSLSDEYSTRLMEQERNRLGYESAEALRSLIATDSRDLLGGANTRPLYFLRQLLEPYAAAGPPTRLTVSGIDFFFGMYGVEPVVNALTAVKMENARCGGLVVASMNKRGDSDPVESRLATLADCLIELVASREGGHADKLLHIRKLRNRPTEMGVAPYRIGRNGFELDALDRIL